jgi:signal transduction histidine kinase
VNLAHTLVALGEPIKAVQVYQNVIKKFGASSASGAGPREAGALDVSETSGLYVYVARAHFEARHLKEAIQALRQALVLVPDTPPVLYNLAYTLAEEAFRVIALPAAERSLEQVETAVMQLQESLGHFLQLQSMVTALADTSNRLELRRAALNGDVPDAQPLADSASVTPGSPEEIQQATAAALEAKRALDELGFSQFRLDGIVSHIRNYLPSAQMHLDAARVRSEQALALQLDRARLMEERQRGKEAAEAAARAEAERAAEERQRAAKELMDALAAQQATWAVKQAEATSESGAKIRRRVAKATASRSDGGRDYDEEEEDEEALNLAKLKAEQEINDLFKDDEDDKSSVSSSDSSSSGGSSTSSSSGSASELQIDVASATQVAATQEINDIFGDEDDDSVDPGVGTKRARDEADEERNKPRRQHVVEDDE